VKERFAFTRSLPNILRPRFLRWLPSRPAAHSPLPMEQKGDPADPLVTGACLACKARYAPRLMQRAARRCQCRPGTSRDNPINIETPQAGLTRGQRSSLLKFLKYKRASSVEAYVKNLRTFCENRGVGLHVLLPRRDASSSSSASSAAQPLTVEDLKAALTGVQAAPLQWYEDTRGRLCMLYDENGVRLHDNKTGDLLPTRTTLARQFPNHKGLRPDCMKVDTADKFYKLGDLRFHHDVLVVWRVPIEPLAPYWCLPVRTRLLRLFEDGGGPQGQRRMQRLAEMHWKSKEFNNEDATYTIQNGILDFLDDVSMPSCAWARMRFQLHGEALWRFKQLSSGLQHALSGDEADIAAWSSLFTALVNTEIDTGKGAKHLTNPQRDRAWKMRAWDILYPDTAQSADEVQTCHYCGERNEMLTRNQYLDNTLVLKKNEAAAIASASSTSPSNKEGKKKATPMKQPIHQSHILPRQWGNIDDKYWWNCIPICCNLKQSRGSKQQGGKEEADDSSRTEHMFMALLSERRIKAIRAISLKMYRAVLEHCLKHPNLTRLLPEVMGVHSLLGFVQGFYSLRLQPDLPDENKKYHWDALLLTDFEVAEFRHMMPPEAEDEEDAYDSDESEDEESDSEEGGDAEDAEEDAEKETEEEAGEEKQAAEAEKSGEDDDPA